MFDGEFVHLVAANDEESSMVSNELDVEYTEVVHPQPADPARGKQFAHNTRQRSLLVYLLFAPLQLQTIPLG